MLREGWRSVTKVFLLACVFDVAYQLLVFRRVYPVEALLVAGGLAFIPYLLLRGPVARLMR
jgi:hypothetical protein